MTFRPIILSSLALPIATSIAFAETVTELDSVLVTASRTANLEQLPASTTVISAEDIKRSSARTLAELLAQQTGITTTSLFSHGSRANVGIRSFGETATQNTLILLDGRRLNDIDLSTVNFAAIAIDNIKRIEIVRGSGNVLYGDGATTGTINIITYDPSKTENDAKFTLTTGSHDHREANAFASYSNDYFALTANINSVKDDGYRDNNQFRQNTGQFDLRIPSRIGQLYLKAGAFEQDSELPGVRTIDPTLNLNQLKTNRTGTATSNDWADEYTEFATLGLSRELNDNDSFVIDMGYRRKQQRSQFDYGFGFGDYTETASKTLSFTPRLTLNRELLGHAMNWQIGSDVYLYEYDSKRSNFKANIAQPAHTIAVDQRSIAFYTQASVDLSEQTIFTAGIRHQNVVQEARDRFDPTAPGAAFGSEAADFNESDRKTSFEIGLKHYFTNALSAYGRIGRSARFGTVDELFELDSGFQQVFSQLKPQTSDDIEFGINYDSRKWQAGISVFHQSLDNEIRFNPITFQNINLDKTQHEGVEIDLGFNVNETTKITANYTYLDAEFTNGTNKGNDIPLIPSNQFNIAVYKQFSHQIDAAVNYRYVDNSYFANDLSNSFGSKLPSYKTVDLNVSKQLDIMTLSLRVHNLFNEQYFNFGVNSTSTMGRFNAYPLPERTAYLTVSFDLH